MINIHCWPQIQEYHLQSKVVLIIIIQNFIILVNTMINRRFQDNFYVKWEY